MKQRKTKKHETSRLELAGMILTLTYALSVPIFDIRHKISMAIGNNFLDPQGNTTTFEQYLSYLSYVPLLIFAFIWAYASYKKMRVSKWSKLESTAVGLVIVGFSFLLYVIVGLYFGLAYHFTS